ncbi:MAG: hypothetical protein Q4D82_00660 [Neisseria sp.]|nr:hypothetical protein [Neisseria sp.]
MIERTPPKTPSENGESWENRLKQMREQRQPEKAVAAVQPEPKPRFTPGRYSKEEQAAQRYVLGEYLQQWADEHNREAEKQAPEADTAVLLQEDWLNAQTALQGEADERLVAKTATVWLNPKRTKPSENSENAAEAFSDGLAAEAEEGAEAVPVSVNVLEPAGIPANQTVLCLSEAELLERLTRRLLPHLTDAVNGMVRTAVQRQAAQLTYQLQQNLSEEAPELVREILDYNLKAAMGEIRYDLKRKR